MAKDHMPMAWNEPGDNNRKDPWGRNNNNDGPPDLDQIFKKFYEKFFQGGGNNGNNSSNSSGGGVAGGIGIGLILLVLVVLYGGFGFYTVKPDEQAVVTRFGKYNRTVGEGPHWVPKFIENVRVINTENIKSSKHQGFMLTKDENIVEVDFEVQYRIQDLDRYLFNAQSPESSLKEAADSAIRQVVGASYLDNVMTVGKSVIRDEVFKTLVSTLDSYAVGIKVTDVNFVDSKAPDAAVKAAFDDATKAREDQERAKLEAQAYEKKIFPEAEGMAQRILAEATAYKQEMINNAIGETQKFALVLPEYKIAPKVTKRRMYLETVEKVLEDSSKVMVDVDSGNNLIYLPIDKIIGKNNKS